MNKTSKQVMFPTTKDLTPPEVSTFVGGKEFDKNTETEGMLFKWIPGNKVMASVQYRPKSDCIELVRYIKEVLDRVGLNYEDGSVHRYSLSVLGTFTGTKGNSDYNGYYAVNLEHLDRGIISMCVATPDRYNLEFYGETFPPTEKEDGTSRHRKVYHTFKTKAEFERSATLLRACYDDLIGPAQFDPSGEVNGEGCGAIILGDGSHERFEVCKFGLFKKDGVVSLKIDKLFESKLISKFNAKSMTVEFEVDLEKIMPQIDIGGVSKPRKMRKLYLKQRK